MADDRRRRRDLHAGDADDEHRLIAQTAASSSRRKSRRRRSALEQKDWALARKLIERAGELGLLGADVPEEVGGVGLDKVAADRRRRGDRHRRVVRDDVRRADRPRDRPDPLLRHRGAAAEVPAAPRERRVDRRVLPQRVRIGIRRARRAHARDASRPTDRGGSPARRCGSPTAASPTCSSSLPKSTASSSPRSSSSAGFRACRRQGRTQAGPARVVDDAAACCRTRRCRRTICSARSARATRSRSTC